MAKWMILGGACLLIVLTVAVLAWIRRSTVYFVGNSGYVAYSVSEPPAHHVTDAEFNKVIRRFLPGDLFDMLWVSRSDDRYSGLMLTLEGGSPVLSVSFKTQSEQAKLKSFKDALSPLGYVPTENSDGHNGVLTEEYRVTMLEYTLPKSAEAVVEVVNAALANLDPSVKSEYYVSGSSFANGPGASPGVKSEPARTR